MGAEFPAVPAAAPAPKKGRGCFCSGCLLLLILLLVAALGVGALVLRLPAKLGIWPSGEALLSGTPDRAGAAAILEELKADGIETTGLTLYVVPVTGQSGTLAYAILDTSAGFDFSATSAAGTSPIPDMFTRLVAGPAATESNVAQVAIEYRGISGEAMGVLTASTQSIRDFASGAIDQAAFSNALHGTFNPAGALGALSGGAVTP